MSPVSVSHWPSVVQKHPLDADTLELVMSLREHLISLYARVGVPLDRLPYSSELDRIVLSLSESGYAATCREVWRELVNLRKNGKLPRLGR